MKLQIFNKENCSAKSNGRPAVSMSPKGMINFNATLVKIMGIKEGNGIEIGKTEDDDWYAFKSSDKGAFKIRIDDSGYGKIQSSVLAKKIIDSIAMVGEQDLGQRVEVAENPVQDKGISYFLLLNKTVKSVKPRK